MSWTVVFTSYQPHIVELVKSILHENDIQCVTIDRRDSMYKSFSLPAIEVYIQSEDFIRSKKLLEKIENE